MKQVTKCKHWRKWTDIFLWLFPNRGIKISRVYSILITKSIDLQLFTSILYGVGGPLWSKAIFHAQSIYRKVYDIYIKLLYIIHTYIFFLSLSPPHYLVPSDALGRLGTIDNVNPFKIANYCVCIIWSIKNCKWLFNYPVTSLPKWGVFCNVHPQWFIYHE